MGLPYQTTLSTYRQVLRILDENSRLSSEQALSILCTRDALQCTLNNQSALSVQQLQSLKELDTKLRANKQKICKSVDLTIYRASLATMPQAWWWYLDVEFAAHPRDSYDWLFKLLTIGSWTAILTLLLNIGDRFFAGGIGITGAAAVILPALLTLLKARSDLTDAGKEGFEHFLNKFNIPKHWQAEAKFGSTILLLLGILGLWLSLPTIANFYNRQGFASYKSGRLRQAEQLYLRSIALDPDHPESHYNLAVLYEDWQLLDEAKQAYQIAARNKIVRAHNNLARLWIIAGDYSKAVTLIQQGLNFGAEDENLYPEDRYNLYKNLGWARLGQKRYDKAKQALDIAIKLANDPDTRNFIQKPASAHCLMAQVLDSSKQVNEHWRLCCQWGNTVIPEEDNWLHLAHQALKDLGETCPLPPITP